MCFFEIAVVLVISDYVLQRCQQLAEIMLALEHDPFFKPIGIRDRKLFQEFPPINIQHGLQLSKHKFHKTQSTDAVLFNLMHQLVEAFAI